MSILPPNESLHQLRQFNIVREIFIGTAVKTVSDLPSSVPDEQRASLEAVPPHVRSALDGLGLDSGDRGRAAAQWKRAVRRALAPGRPTPAQLVALADLFGFGPVRLTRQPRQLCGFHPRKLEGPPSLRGPVFLGLVETGWLRLVDGDSIEALWDLSPAGVDALRRWSPGFASIDARFVDSRLERADSEFEITGGVTLQGPLGMPLPHAVVSRTERDRAAEPPASPVELRAGVRHTPGKTLADRIRARVAATRREGAASEGSLTSAINGMLAYAYAYLDLVVAGAMVDLTILVEKGRASATWAVSPSSWDSTAAPDDARALGEVVQPVEMLPATRGASVALRFRILKTRRGGVSRRWIAPRFELSSLSDSIRAAGDELRPSGVHESSSLELVFCGRRSSRRRQSAEYAPARLLHWGWHSAETRHGNYRIIRFPQALIGRNARKMSRRAVELAEQWCDRKRRSVGLAWTVTFSISFDAGRWESNGTGEARGAALFAAGGAR